MANRAYLWSTDLEEPDIWKAPSVVCSENQPYYDSRHNIPFAWFFLFQLSDLRMVEVYFRDATWREVRLFARKEIALNLFAERQRLLYDAIGTQLEPASIDNFKKLIHQRPGMNLMMDPHEVTDGWSDEENFLNFSRILETLDTKTATVQEILQVTSNYTRLDDPKMAELNIIGYTYWEK